MSRKKRCIVHIGMPKTGTSTLQEVLHNTIGGSSGSFSYMKLDTPNHGGAIYSLFAENPFILNYHRLNRHNTDDILKFNEKNRSRIESDFIKHDTENKIISGEDIFHMSEEELRQFKNFLNNYFEEIVVVGYVRPVSSFLNSSFQQLVKFHELNFFDLRKIYPYYRIKFEKFDSVFGSENVKLYLYDTSKFPGGDIVKHFSNQFGIKIEDKKIRKMNESITKELISILFTYNLYNFDRKDFGKKNTLIHRKMIDQLSDFGRSRFSFSRRFVDAVIKNNISDIEWIEERIGEKFPLENIETPCGVDSEENLRRYACDIYFEFYEYIKGRYGKNIIRNLDKASCDNIFELIERLKNEIFVSSY